jgi:H+/Cl- antiporter ClcA
MHLAFAVVQSPHLTSATLAGLGAIFGLAGLLFYWASVRATDAARSGDPVESTTRAAAGLALLFVALGFWGCAVVCSVTGGIVYFAGH